MARCPIVRPDVIRLPLSEGDFIDVKKRLNTGEYRGMLISQYREPNAGEPAIVNLEAMGFNKVVAYVVGWSFVDLDGNPLDFNADTLRHVDPDVFAEVLAAVEKHEAASEKERAEKKTGKAGENGSSAILTSPSALVGATSGSTN